jgi:AcrR family transcriptional regulator
VARPASPAGRFRTQAGQCPEKPGQAAAEVDARVRRTRQALREAFFKLISTRPYDDFGVADIAGRAGVARSTFYEHFRGKDDLLLASLGDLLDVLAQCPQPGADPGRLDRVLCHFWDNRRLDRATFGGPARPRIARALALRVESNLGPAASVPAARLLARQISEGMLGLLLAWLTGELAGDASAMAVILRQTAQASAQAMVR